MSLEQSDRKYLTNNKGNGDRFMDGEQNHGQWEGALEGGRIEQKGKRTHGERQQCGDCWGQEGIRGLKGNVKNTIKIVVK